MMGRKTFGALVSVGSFVLIGAPIIAGRLVYWDPETSSFLSTRAWQRQRGSPTASRRGS